MMKEKMLLKTGKFNICKQSFAGKKDTYKVSFPGTGYMGFMFYDLESAVIFANENQNKIKRKIAKGVLNNE